MNGSLSLFWQFFEKPSPDSGEYAKIKFEIFLPLSLPLPLHPYQ